MTVRVWLRPNELGECGNVITFPEANAYRRTKGGALVLICEREDDTEDTVGRVEPERWDAVVVTEESTIEENE